MNDSSGSDDDSRQRRPWNTDREWAHLRERIDAAEFSPRIATGTARRIVALAAAALLIVAAGVTWRATRATNVEPRVVSTQPGERIVLRLADSSLVTLGPSTTIRYVASGGERNVELSGLADFNVVHDASRPFVVRTGNVVTRDVGTEFVVRAYSSDSVVRVAVSSGAVSVSSGGSAAVAMHAGDVVSVGIAGIATLEQRAEFDATTAWVNGRLIFDATPLDEVSRELGRWFNVDIRVADPALGRRAVSAVYNRPSLNGVLDALAATMDITWERTGRSITIQPRGR